MKKSKDVMDYSEDNFAIVFAAMGVRTSFTSNSGYEMLLKAQLLHALSTCIQIQGLYFKCSLKHKEKESHMLRHTEVRLIRALKSSRPLKA